MELLESFSKININFATNITVPLALHSIIEWAALLAGNIYILFHFLFPCWKFIGIGNYPPNDFLVICFLSLPYSFQRLRATTNSNLYHVIEDEHQFGNCSYTYSIHPIQISQGQQCTGP